VFNPDPDNNSVGKARIVSLILPDNATNIGEAGPSHHPPPGPEPNYLFSAFTALETVYGAGVTALSDFAFKGCTTLKNASFPAARFIEGPVFEGCTALEEVSFPAVTEIGTGAFKGCASLRAVTLGATPPWVLAALNIGIFDGITTPRTVTVRIPAGSDVAAAYGVSTYDNSDTETNNWGNAFRGRGLSGNPSIGYQNQTANANISLVFETYPPE
jgi:hypothetical protein